jgi:hypothetical protein
MIKKNLPRLLIIFSSLFILSLFLLIFTQPVQGLPKPLYNIIILWPNLDSGKPNLQLYTFPYITIALPTPTPASGNPANPSTPQNPGTSPNPNHPPNTGPYCDDPEWLASGRVCQCAAHDFSIACPVPPSGCIVGGPDAEHRIHIPDPNGPEYCVKYAIQPNLPPPPGCMAGCIAKPVIYLYPPRATDVSVSVVAPGSVVVSDPHYPDGGWKHVLAHPDGTLIYSNKKYSELFYETSLTQKVPEPKKAIVFASKDTESILRKTTTQFGLNPLEQKEFLDYWVPRLQSLHSPYIFFSILDPEVKEPLDKLVISPEPETRIEIIAYFKPLQTPVQVTPLSPPNQPPGRVGFTEVEWGGTIAN